MSRADAFVIEIGGQQYGLVVQCRTGFCFYAASSAAAPLDGQKFSSPDAAYAAVKERLRLSAVRSRKLA